MLPTDGMLSAEQRAKVRRHVLGYIKARGYSQAQVAHKLGSNQTYISNFLSGAESAIPAATLDKLVRDLNEWTELDARRTARQSSAGFVHTKVAERLIKVARHAIETADMVIAHGPAGCGKTATLTELRKLIPASLYVYITPESARKAGLLRALYEAVWEHRAGGRVTLSQVLERLTGSDRLVMLDNADLLTPDTYPLLMALHDVARVPILIVGTYQLVRRLTHDEDPLRGQLSSRIGMRAELLRERTNPRRGGRPEEWITSDQIRSIFEGGRVKLHPQVVARLKEIANSAIGHLRRCERYLRYAQLYCAKGTALITPELLDRAIALVDGLAPPASPPLSDAGERQERTA